MPSLLTLTLNALYSAGVANGSHEEEAFELVLPFSTVSHSDWMESVQLWQEIGPGLLDSQPSRGCPACGSARHRPLFYSYDGYPYSDCLECGCWYVPKRVEPSLFERFFSLKPEAREIAQRALEKRASAENLELDLSRIGGYLERLKDLCSPAAESPRYLDIGASTGSSLIAAQQRGMRAVGLEVNEKSAEVARARGVDIYAGFEALPDGPFNLISLWESLEHISDPLSVLTAAAARLKPGGLLALTIPNADSPIVKIMRGDCSFVTGGTDAPGHINFFGASQLERLLQRAGLRLIHVDGEYGVDYVELAGYQLGRHRGAVSLLSERPFRYRLPATLARSLQAAGPAISLVERESVLSPILFAVAARDAEEGEVQHVAERLAKQRDISLLREANRLELGISDPRQQLEALQSEVNVRDEMLQRLQATASALQSEVNVRDEMLQRLQATANELQAALAKAQEEIDTRDEILRRLAK